MEVKIKKLYEGARLPERQTDGSAGYDLYASRDEFIYSGRNVIKLGFAMQMPKGWVATIRPRSGFSARGFAANSMMPNTVIRIDADVLCGTIDSDYRGEVGVIVKNTEQQTYVVKKGSRIAQMVFQRYESPTLQEVDELDDTERGKGGYGHTGVGGKEEKA